LTGPVTNNARLRSIKINGLKIQKIVSQHSQGFYHHQRHTKYDSGTFSHKKKIVVLEKFSFKNQVIKQ
jgi:hypothetical protein